MAGVKVYIATGKIWDHYWKNIAAMFNNEHLVAENKDTGVSLYLTRENALPNLIIYDKDNQPRIYREIHSREECNAAAVNMITMYLVGVIKEEKPKVISLPAPDTDGQNDPEPDKDEEEQNILDTIYEREDELLKAVGDMLAVVLLEDDYTAVVEGYTEKFIGTVVDDLLQYLYDDHGISVYRPTLIEDEDGGPDILAEYPYGWGSREESTQ